MSLGALENNLPHIFLCLLIEMEMELELKIRVFACFALMMKQAHSKPSIALFFSLGANDKLKIATTTSFYFISSS